MKNMFKKFNFLILSLVVAVGFSACMKDDIEVYDFQKYLDLEAPILEAYVNSEPGLEGAVRDSSGIWYKIIEPGLQDSIAGKPDYYRYNINNANQIEAPRLRVNYEGKLVSNGFVFDEAEMKPDDTPISLARVIYGWQLAFLPKHLRDKQGALRNVGGLTQHGLQKGAKIRIVLPSPYGYQNVAQGSIPANSPLDFYIEVLEVKPPAAPTAN
jgi:FKBP-type peptidyl-prolyl cis-trans isomerase FkpA